MSDRRALGHQRHGSSWRAWLRNRRRRGVIRQQARGRDGIRCELRSSVRASLSRFAPISIGVRAFGAVLQELTGLGVDTDFVGHASILDIEGIAQPAAALFLLQLFVGDFSRKGF